MEGGILDSTEIEIALYGLEAPGENDGRLEPVLGLAPVMIGFEEAQAAMPDGEPLADGTARFQPELLDLAKAVDEPEEPYPEPLPLPRLGPAGSILFHLLLLIVLLIWPETPMEASDPIPVQLVIETPKPQPQQQQQAAATPPPRDERIIRSSDESGEIKPAQKPEESEAQESPPPPAPEKAEQQQSPPPKPPPPLPQQEAAAIPPPPPPKPNPPPPKPAVHPAVRAAAPVVTQPPQELYRPPVRRASVQGPPATRDEYLATLVRMTRQHIDLLPMSFLGDRRGEARVGVRVLPDGTIANVAVVESSGYPDIDRQIEKMVLAVRRFPPLPQWFQGPDMQLELRLRFPDALRD